MFDVNISNILWNPTLEKFQWISLKGMGPWGYKTFLAPQTKQQILQISCGCKVSASKTVATSTTTVM